LTAYTPALDGLRGIAIILVLLHHLTVYRPTRGIDEWIATVPLIGWTGVDLFFVLSGFLITGILIDARGSQRYFTSFYARRTLRIFPLYYTVVFTALVLVPLSQTLHRVLVGPYPDPPHLPYWLYYTNFSIAERGLVHGWLDIAWSLAIEEQFYIVWAVVVFVCWPRLLGAICALIVLLSPLARMWAWDRAMDPTAIYVTTWFRLDGLATGAVLAWLVRPPSPGGSGATSQQWITPIARYAPWAALAGVIALGFIIRQNGDAWWWHRSMQIAGFSTTALTGGAMLVSAIGRGENSLWSRALSMGWLRAFGKYSYSLYLFHLPVMRSIREWVFDPADYAVLVAWPWVGQILFYVIATAPAFALSWLSWRYFEAPILRLKEKFPY
jgi:peptidoglycan/LPS O-acetylase OafA/YrhL